MTICVCCGLVPASPYSPATGLPIESQTVSQMVDKIIEFPAGSKLLLLSPVARGKKASSKEIEALQRQATNASKLTAKCTGLKMFPL